VKPTELDHMNQLRVQAEREVARLKEALEEILSIEPMSPEGGHEAVAEIHGLARNALGVPVAAATKPCPECKGVGHFPFGNGLSAGKCADCNATGRVPVGVGERDGG
jgi:hypothetical protein